MTSIKNTKGQAGNTAMEIETNCETGRKTGIPGVTEKEKTRGFGKADYSWDTLIVNSELDQAGKHTEWTDWKRKNLFLCPPGDCTGCQVTEYRREWHRAFVNRRTSRAVKVHGRGVPTGKRWHWSHEISQQDRRKRDRSTFWKKDLVPKSVSRSQNESRKLYGTNLFLKAPYQRRLAYRRPGKAPYWWCLGQTKGNEIEYRHQTFQKDPVSVLITAHCHSIFYWCTGAARGGLIPKILRMFNQHVTPRSRPGTTYASWCFVC